MDAWVRPSARSALDLEDVGTSSGASSSGCSTGAGSGSGPLGSDKARPARGFNISLSLCLPRDRLSVPVVRHLVHHALAEVGVMAEDSADVELALAEACANVLAHSGPGDAYEVSIVIGPVVCEIRIVDIGHGFDFESLGSEMSAADAESGRGVALMRATMDQVRFTSEPEQGTVVHLVKHLRFDDSRPARRLMLQALAREDTAGPGG